MDNINDINKIQGLSAKDIISSMNSGSNCKCEGQKNGFDVAMMSLMNALSRKEREKNISSEEKKIDNKLEDITDIKNNTNQVEVISKDEETKRRIELAVEKASIKHGVDKNLIKAIIKVESNFNPNVVSSAGAKGLMQLMPENCRDLGVKDPFNIEENIDAGTRHIKEYLDMYDGNVEMALMAYNGGPTRMRKRGVVSPSDIYKMPKETQNYVPKVMKIYRG